jgi:nucleotide-binding universal stress UspA family protein
MTIICATDFSAPARHAEEAAAALAGRLAQPLWLLHVQEPDVEQLAPAAEARVQALLRERLVESGSRLEKLAGKPINVAVKLGRPAHVVREFAKAHDANLIVIGSAGHGASALVKLGGTSERLASGSEIPVMVVREGDSFREWAEGRPFRALIGLEEGEASASALRWLTRLRAAGPLDVVVGRVYYAADAHQHYGVASRRAAYTEPDATVESLIERDLKRLVPSLPGQGELFYRAKLGMGRVADHLLELAEAERCQLIVVGSHKHTGISRMWSVSSATLHLARMAVAVIPPDGKGVGALVPSPRLERVMVATDFSALGNAAVPWAYTLVKNQGEVILAHVTPGEGYAGRLDELYSPALPAPHESPRVEAEVAARLRALTPPSAADRGVVTRTEVVRGSDPAKALIVLSEQLGVDAIVIAAHGRASVARAVRGSVAEEVLRGSTRPVLVVRQPHG